MPDTGGDEVSAIEQPPQQEEELHRASRRAGALRRHAIPSPRAFVCESARETSGAVPTDIPHFFARVLVLAYPDRLTGGGHLFFLQALLSGSDPTADDQSHDHGRSSAPVRHRLREPVQRTGDPTIATDPGVPRSTIRGAPHRVDRGQPGSGGSDRAGTPTRGPETPTTRPETRGAAPARTGPPARLHLHVVRRATARWSGQAADPACHRPGPCMHPVADTPAAPPSVAESVPRVATATPRGRGRDGLSPVGSSRPPHRSQRAALPHWALTSGSSIKTLLRPRV